MVTHLTPNDTPWATFVVLQGTTEKVPWPWWCQLVAALMILASVVWIPLIAALKYFRITQWKEEAPAFFPADELAEERSIQPHEDTWIETHIFGFKK
jgi:hypothetical protein